MNTFQKIYLIIFFFGLHRKYFSNVDPTENTTTSRQLKKKKSTKKTK